MIGGFNGGFNNGFNGGFNFMFTVFPILFIVVFMIIIGAFIIVLVKGVSRWSKNNNSPVLTVDVTVVAKRTDVSDFHNNMGNGTMHHDHYTSYYTTFQVQSGDRMEFVLPSDEYGMLVEGDMGKLTFQGTRYISFERYR